MQKITFYCTIAALISGLLLSPINLSADATVTMPSEATLQASAAASLSWLGLVDNGNYGKSWDDASTIMKLTVPKDEWITILTKIRKPKGSVRSRQVLDQRVAKDPQGLPKGDYIVMFYKTDFTGKAGAHELVTLFLEDGKWSVLTYQVD